MAKKLSEHDRSRNTFCNALSVTLTAPALAKGDVIVWGSHTVHGALPTRDPTRSRRSLTARYIPDGHAFGNFFLRKDYLRYHVWKGHPYYRNQPDDSLWQRAKARLNTEAYDSPALLRLLRTAQRAIGNR